MEKATNGKKKKKNKAIILPSKKNEIINLVPSSLSNVKIYA